jgi:hypothetical protein
MEHARTEVHKAIDFVKGNGIAWDFGGCKQAELRRIMVEIRELEMRSGTEGLVLWLERLDQLVVLVYDFYDRLRVYMGSLLEMKIDVMGEKVEPWQWMEAGFPFDMKSEPSSSARLADGSDWLAQRGFDQYTWLIAFP